MNTSIPGVRIRAISSALPGQVQDLLDLGQRYGQQEVRRIMRSTGIEAIRVAGALSTGDLCTAAIRSLLEQADIDTRSIDGIIVVTQTPDCAMPGTSALVQHRAGLGQHVLAWDINLGCSGYVYGLYQAALLVAAGGCRRVLVCTGDVITKLLHPDEHQVRMVFGDAATATLVEPGTGDMGFGFRTDGQGMPHLHTPLTYTQAQGPMGWGTAQTGFLHMDGAEVMSFVLSQVPPAIADLLNERQMAISDVPLFVMHQANRLILHYLAKCLHVDPRLVPVQLAQVGNTGPSSIPLTMSMGVTGTSFHQDNVVLCGFGVGLSVGVAQCSLQHTLFIPPVDVPTDALAAKENSHEPESHLV